MGTRADFYVGRGKTAEWIGSIAWDGYWDGIDPQVVGCTSEAAFRHAVADFFKDREDATLPEQGWPWPWNTSATTDCVYAFDDSEVWQECSEHWVSAQQEPPEDPPEDAMPCEWPDMSEKKNVTFGPRSGLIVVTKP